MAKGTDTAVLLLLVIAIIAVAILAIVFLPLVLASILVIVAIVIIVLVVLVLAGFLAAVPFYFLKRGKDSVPGSYKMEQVDDLKDQERK